MDKNPGLGPSPAVDSSTSANKPKVLFSSSLKISGNQRAASTKDGSSMGAFYKKNPTLVKEAVEGALKEERLQVRNITADSIIMIVEFDSFVVNFENKNVKKKLERKLADLGFKAKLDVTITNKEDVDNKMDQTR